VFICMSKRPAVITQSEIERAIRAAKKAGATEVEVRVKDQVSIVYRFTQTAGDPLAETREIVL
jgi:hypothetical protein